MHKSNMLFNEDGSPDFYIYPNSAKDRIQIQNKTQEQTVEILNINGKVLLMAHDNSIDISQLPTGIYLLRLYDYEEVIYSGLFIKRE